MKFVLFARANAESEAGVVPDQKLVEAMLDYNEALARAGVLIAGEGLHPSSEGARVSYSAGKPTVVDGPFPTGEVIAGFWVIDVASTEEAASWALRVPYVADGEAIEIRQVFDEAEFPEEMLTPELASRERALRDQVASSSPS